MELELQVYDRETFQPIIHASARLYYNETKSSPITSDTKEHTISLGVTDASGYLEADFELQGKLILRK